MGGGGGGEVIAIRFYNTAFQLSVQLKYLPNYLKSPPKEFPANADNAKFCM